MQMRCVRQPMWCRCNCRPYYWPADIRIVCMTQPHRSQYNKSRTGPLHLQLYSLRHAQWCKHRDFQTSSLIMINQIHITKEISYKWLVPVRYELMEYIHYSHLPLASLQQLVTHFYTLKEPAPLCQYENSYILIYMTDNHSMQYIGWSPNIVTLN